MFWGSFPQTKESHCMIRNVTGPERGRERKRETELRLVLGKAASGFSPEFITVSLLLISQVRAKTLFYFL